ncbi:Neurochondrin-domain-containing protein [Podospora aff. communis PSN243]|uniref:Neurochondrin-domain-containing protein n=1 Tax=Podospora aff. communis PSN243 TaxID=3040156 RepID=A0AAV9H7J4_9PEZI|nr:Neurochondrin-domain-containing protein [Podospora aff. communis PSN243]
MDTPASSTQNEGVSVERIETLLKSKDDTSRFVGLALLKSVLDNSEELRSNEDIVVRLWESIPSRFLDRLIRTGSRKDPSKKDSHNMLDLAVYVLHTFCALLPENKRKEGRVVDRIPQLVACLLNCPEKTTQPVLETLVSLVSQPAGALVLVSVEDLSPLTEIASSQPLALEVLLHTWLNSSSVADKAGLPLTIDKTVGNLVASFKGTDAVTLLDFLAKLLRGLEPEVLPPSPSWMPSLGKFIFNLVISRPTAASRAAFTNLSAALLESYPLQAPQLVFANETNSDEKPYSYLLINLMLVDLRSSLPLLLEQLNSPQYPVTARRLSSAFNVVSNYIGYLLRLMDAPSPSFALSPDHLLKLRRSISETMSVAVEFLRDRYDASVAGALGLHPEARTATATLTWDSKDSTTVHSDPLILAAIQALAIWLREDDNEMLRKEAAGLSDMFIDLYQRSSSPSPNSTLDFRRPILVALEGITAESKGVSSFLDNSGWNILSSDLISILTSPPDDNEASRGIEIIRILLPIVEAETPGPREQWMDLVTKVAAWYYVPPEDRELGVVEEFQVAVMQLVTALLVGTHQGVRRRYVHSMSAMVGLAGLLKKKVVSGKGDEELLQGIDDVLETLGRLR